MESDKGPPDAPLSEVGSRPLQNEEKQPDETSAARLLSNMETLLMRVLATPQATTVSRNTRIFLEYNPDDPDTDIDDWCRVTEVIVQSKHLEGVDLFVALTSALKGSAAACLTKLDLGNITWDIENEVEVYTERDDP